MSVFESVARQEERALSRLRDLYRRYGYSQFKMSKFEEYDLYVRNKSFLLSDHVITFTDTDGKLMALKPDVTLSIVKSSRDKPDGVRKVYYNENVYRVPRGEQSFREIMQTGLECIGDIDTYCIAEVLILAAKSLAVLSPHYVLDISHLGVVSKLIDRLGVSDTARQQILQCVGEKNPHGIDGICRTEGIDPDGAEDLKKLMTADGDCDRMLALLAEADCKEEATALSDILSAVRFIMGDFHIRLDLSVVNDMNYYNGIAFSGFIDGIPTSILSGGQYDNLMRKMGKQSGAIGFAVYLDLIDRLYDGSEDYDADAVIVYEGQTDAAIICNQVDALTAEGNRVIVRRTVPTRMRYKKLIKIVDGEVQIIEDNA